jgi:hypothetical protein
MLPFSLLPNLLQQAWVVRTLPISTNFKMLAPLQIQVNSQASAKSKKQGKEQMQSLTWHYNLRTIFLVVTINKK